MFGGFKYLGVILVTAIPFGIYDLIEALDNVESASAAGDPFPTTQVLTADGIISLIGCLLGNPFINAVYIGHPGWKAMGGRIGYSAVTGVVILALTWFGIIALLSAIIPVVAILPILLYIGMLIGSQAFQETPHRHAPAIVLALLPQIAEWGKTQIDNALGAAGTSAAAVGMGKLASVGVLYGGLETLGAGATLGGHHAGRDHRIHHRPRTGQGRLLRRGRCGADLLRLHPWPRHRRVPLARGRGGLSRRGADPVGLPPLRGDRAGDARGARAGQRRGMMQNWAARTNGGQ